MVLVRLIRVGVYLALLVVAIPAVAVVGCVLAMNNVQFGWPAARWTLKKFTVDAWRDVPACFVRVWRQPW